MHAATFSTKNKISIKRSHSASFLTYIVCVWVCVSAHSVQAFVKWIWLESYFICAHEKCGNRENRFHFSLSIFVTWRLLVLGFAIRADSFRIQHSAFKPHHHSYFSFWMPCIDVQMHSQYLSMFLCPLLLFSLATYVLLQLHRLSMARFGFALLGYGFGLRIAAALFTPCYFTFYFRFWSTSFTGSFELCIALLWMELSLSLSRSRVLRLVDFSNAIFYYYCFHPNCFASIKEQQQQQSQR